MDSNRSVSLYKSERARGELLGYYDRILSKWPVAFEERLIESPCGTTHLLVCGAQGAPPLLLFHGTGNNSLMWRPNVAALAERFRLHLVDTVNDPGKSQASRAFNPETDYARWVTEVLDALGIGRASLVGHSKGGWIVLNTAIAAPSRVDRIVLLAPAVGINSSLRPAFMRKSLRLGLFPTKRSVQSYLRYMSAPGSSISKEYAEYLARVIRGTRHPMVKHREFTDAELGSIRAPALLVFGDHEVSVEYEKVVERARRCIPTLRVEIVAGAGHALQGEKPAEVSGLMLRHLEA